MATETCLRCGARTPGNGELCGKCKAYDRERPPLTDEEELERAMTGPPPDMAAMVAETRRALRECQVRFNYEQRRTMRMSDGKSTGAKQDKGLPPSMLQTAKTLHDMTISLMKEWRQWVEWEEKQGAGQTPQEQTATAGDWLSSSDVPAEDKRKQVARILASMGEEYPGLTTH